MFTIKWTKPQPRPRLLQPWGFLILANCYARGSMIVCHHFLRSYFFQHVWLTPDKKNCKPMQTRHESSSLCFLLRLPCPMDYIALHVTCCVLEAGKKARVWSFRVHDLHIGTPFEELGRFLMRHNKSLTRSRVEVRETFRSWNNSISIYSLSQWTLK